MNNKTILKLIINMLCSVQSGPGDSGGYGAGGLPGEERHENSAARLVNPHGPQVLA